MESFNQNVIKHKTGLLNLAAEPGNISKDCRLTPGKASLRQSALIFSGAHGPSV